MSKTQPAESLGFNMAEKDKKKSFKFKDILVNDHFKQAPKNFVLSNKIHPILYSLKKLYQLYCRS